MPICLWLEAEAHRRAGFASTEQFGAPHWRALLAAAASQPPADHAQPGQQQRYAGGLGHAGHAAAAEAGLARASLPICRRRRRSAAQLTPGPDCGRSSCAARHRKFVETQNPPPALIPDRQLPDWLDISAAILEQLVIEKRPGAVSRHLAHSEPADARATLK